MLYRPADCPANQHAAVTAPAAKADLELALWVISNRSPSQAKITVSVDGVDQPVEQRLLKGGYGSKYAIAFNPKGWKSEAGFTYHVSVAGISKPFSYDVEVLNCGGK